jgi:uncharacterized membrane protein
MHFNLIDWLFQDPTTAGYNTAAGAPEQFHFYLPWIIFCSVGLLIGFYYSVEGRKRLFKNKPLIKYMLDRYLFWLGVLCVIAFFIMGFRYAIPYAFFAWRVWRYLWLAGLLAWAITWVVYLVRKYPQERASDIAYQKSKQYIRQKRKAKAASR